MTRSKHFFIATISLGVLSAGCIAPSISKNKNDADADVNIVNQETQTESTTTTNDNAPADENTNSDEMQALDTSDWQTYTNVTYGFSFKYPKDWHIEKDQNTIYSPGILFLSDVHIGNQSAEMPLDNSIDFAVTELDLTSITNNIEKSDLTPTGESLAKVSDINNVTINNRTFNKGSHATAIGIPTNFYYTPLPDYKALFIFYSDLDEARTSINEQIIQTLQWDDTPSLAMLTHDYHCFSFIHQHEFIDPNAVLYIQHIESLRALADDWEWGDICESTDQSDVYVVSVDTMIEPEESDAAVVNKTLAAYPSAKEQISLDSGYEYYQFYLFVDHDSELSFGSTNKTFSAGTLTPITDLAWGTALANCYVQPGDYIADQGVIISCGFGDNGCVDAEQVKWNVLTGEPVYVSRCINKCDLAEGEPFTLSCQ